MRLDNLFQFIVPLTFLAIWALTSLFNRDSEPLPPRPVRPPDPDASRFPGESAGTGVDERKPDADRSQARPYSQPNPRPFEPRFPNRAGDGIVILETQGTRPPQSGNASRRTSGSAGRRPGRTRQAPPAPKPEPATNRALSGALQMERARQLDADSALRPLSLPASSPLMTASTVSDVVPSPTSGAPGESPSSASGSNPSLNARRLRESFLISELFFRPPLSLRNGPLPLRRKG